MSGRSTRARASVTSRTGAQARSGVTARSQQAPQATLLQNLADQVQELFQRTNNLSERTDDLHQAFEESTPRLPPSTAEFESTPPRTAEWPHAANVGGTDDSAWAAPSSINPREQGPCVQSYLS